MEVGRRRRGSSTNVVEFKRPAYRQVLGREPSESSSERTIGAVAEDLFTAAAAERLRAQAPLAARLRPRTIDDVVGQPQLLGPGRPLRRLVEQDKLSSVLLWGPPGTGKTTLALAVAGTTARAFEQLSAVTAGVKDVREVIERARQRLGERDQGTILFLDEIHRFTKAQQDALLPAVEDGTLVLIGATTENPFFEVNPPLRSRSTLFRLDPLGPDDLRILDRARPRGARHDGRAGGRRPARRPQRRRRPPGADVAGGGRRPRPPGRDHDRAHRGRPRHERRALRPRRPLRRDQRVHQVDARLRSRRRHLLAGAHAGGRRGRPLHRPADGDLRQRGRRHGRSRRRSSWPRRPPTRWSSSASPRPSSTWPRPSSTWRRRRRATAARWRSGTPASDIAAGALGEVPAHLRDSHYQGAKVLGHGTGYEYPHEHDHDELGAWVDQQYLPDELSDRHWYRPSRHGHEEEVAGA